ncbi:hypothetical protein [Novosphingobium sp. AP12]|uniref:hypothetical protein n=1 Tax=Novosphingobium sp. AP12 TaxID=1144305 RepID=UPI00030EF569|nr:hypothetical protein [Novosphingobium sp. AP12]
MPLISVTGIETRGDALAFDFSWQPENDLAIGGTLTSGHAGVALGFGPTVAVAHWPAWLRAITHFGEAGGEAGIWLDPHRQAERGTESFWALDMRGARTREPIAAFLVGLADAIDAADMNPSEEQRQAVQTCRGMALALACEAQGGVPAPADWPELFWPASLPLLVDDHNAGTLRRHVRLTYRMPRVGGWLTAGCSLRLFQSERSFGIEFRALDGDLLPAAIVPACIEDDLGPLLRFTIDRGGAGTTFEGEAQADQALRIVRAVARQVSRDMTGNPAMSALTGFQGGPWRHWLAAMPDLLASPSPMSLETAQDH